MEIIFNIVGLTHGAKQEAPMEYAHQAKGKRLALVMDSQNEFDPIAVAVKDGCERIGFVAAQDSEEVRAAMVASGRKMLLATCKGWGTRDGSEQGLYLTAEARFEAKVPLEEAYAQVYDDSQFTCWEYTGPTYCIEQLSDLDSNTDMLEELLNDALQEKTPPDEMAPMIQGLLADFLKNHCFDYSREMRRMRRRICELLSRIAGDCPREENNLSSGGKNERDIPAQSLVSAQSLKALLADMGFITSSEYRDRAARCFFIDTPGKMLRMRTGAYDYSDRLDEIEHQLEAFPDNLYSYFKSDPVDFLRRIFYRRVPRKQMVQLLSGIILMVMNGRVEDVKQWGKHGGREAMKALEDMKEIGGVKAQNDKMDDRGVRREIFDSSLVRIAEMDKPRTYVSIIRSQADWYVVFRLLCEWGEYGQNDEGKFCNRLSALFEKHKLKGKLCKRKDLTQAACELYDSKPPTQWKHINQDVLNAYSKQAARFTRYCDIVDAFVSVVCEEAKSRGIEPSVFFGG